MCLVFSLEGGGAEKATSALETKLSDTCSFGAGGLVCIWSCVSAFAFLFFFSFGAVFWRGVGAIYISVTIFFLVKVHARRHRFKQHSGKCRRTGHPRLEQNVIL